MLGKLIKYDMMFGLKKYITIIALMLALLIGMMLSLATSTSVTGSVVAILLLAIIVSVTYAVLYTVISIQHLYKQMVGNESYLSYTLPVSTNKLLFSKLVTLFIWGAIMSLVLTGFWLIAVERMLAVHTEVSVIGFINEFFTLAGDRTPAIAAVFLVSLICGSVQSLAMLAFSVSLVNLHPLKTRNLGIAAGIVFWIVGGWVIGLIQSIPVFDATFSNFGNSINVSYDSYAEFQQSGIMKIILEQFQQPMLTSTLIASAISLVVGIALYIGAVYLLDRKRLI